MSKRCSGSVPRAVAGLRKLPVEKTNHLISYPLLRFGSARSRSDHWHLTAANPAMMIRKYQGQVDEKRQPDSTPGDYGLMNVAGLRRCRSARSCVVARRGFPMLTGESICPARREVFGAHDGGAVATKARMPHHFLGKRSDLYLTSATRTTPGDWRRGERRGDLSRGNHGPKREICKPPGGGKMDSGLITWQNVGRILSSTLKPAAGDRRRRRWAVDRPRSPVVETRHYGHRRAMTVAKDRSFLAITPRRRARSTISTSFRLEIAQIVGAKADEYMCTTATRTCRRPVKIRTKSAIAAEASTKRYAGRRTTRGGGLVDRRQNRVESGSRRTDPRDVGQTLAATYPFTAAGCSTPGFRHRNGSITAKSVGLMLQFT